MTVGIYAIKNLKNKKIYIGQSMNVEKRLLNHKKLLRNGSHFNTHLQYSFNLHGEEYFSFHIVEEIDNLELLNEAENKWIEDYHSFAGIDGYNIKYPTQAFRLIFHAPNAKCVNCGKMFYSKIKNAKYCSSKCSRHYWNKNHIRIKPKKKKYTKQCKLPSCNKIFLTSRKNKYFCCIEHQKAYWKHVQNDRTYLLKKIENLEEKINKGDEINDNKN